MRGRVAAARLGLGAAVAALGFWAAPAQALDRLRLDDGRLTDEQGRQVVLHGINVHYKIPPYLPHDAGGVRTSFTEAEAEQLRTWGWNTVRLAWSMEGLMPERGQIDQDYLRRYVEMTRMAARHGQYVLVDFHQDEFSRKYKGNGFAPWAADDDGLPFLTSTGHPNDYAQPAVQRAFRNFFADSEGQRTEFVRAFATLARALRDEPGVLGYDLFNEPSCENSPDTGFGKPEEQFSNDPKAAGVCLQPLYDQLVPALRDADPNHPVFYEDFFNTAWGFVPYGVGEPPNKPWPFEDTGLSFHVYCPHPLHNERSCDDLEREAFDRAMANARRNRAWPLLSEFGAVDDLAPIERALDNADRLGVSWQFWALKTWDDPHPGFGADSLNPQADGFALVAKDGTVKEGKLRLLARAYPQRVAGSAPEWSFDEASARFRMTFKPQRGGTTVIALPLSVHYGEGYAVTAQGVEVLRETRGLLELRSTGASSATVEIVPATGRSVPARPGSRARACTSRRVVALRVPGRGRLRPRRLHLSVSGKRARPVSVRRRTVRVSLRGLEAGRHRVLVVARTSRGKRVRVTRVYRTCTRRGTPG